MVNPNLQLMIYETNIAELSVELSDYAGLELAEITKLENPNYLIVDLVLASNIQPGTFEISFKKGKRTIHSYQYDLRERASWSADREGFNSSDVMYLITPDRFANGNPDNDSVEGLMEQVDRQNIGGRHGGDIKGILDNLDYIEEMGFTAIWVNPILENDMESYSYHGYSTTDFYAADARFGTNEEYKELSEKAREKGIKLIMDMIVNHCGSEHWWMSDLPSSDWLNFQDDYLEGRYHITTHQKAVIQDPYASQTDLKDFTDGWFVTTMPDLNQRNPYMATYLTQNTIWWVEYAGLSGIRMDTYPYPDKDYMSDWTCALEMEYPNFNIVGEEWNTNQNIVSHWQRGKENANGYTSCLRSLMDFPLQYAMMRGLTEPSEYYSEFYPEVKSYAGIKLIYEALALDFLYPEPEELVVFPDNHDMSRFYTQVGHDIDLFKLGIALTLTTRGVPQLYYGTEILMQNPGTDDHGVIRSDFPGGWIGDQTNAFTGEGLSDMQKDAKEFVKVITNWRKGQSAVHEGKLLHYVPQNEVYVYFRYNDEDKVMVILNGNEDPVELDLNRFSEVLPADAKGIEIITDKRLVLSGTLIAPGKAPMIIDLD